MGKHRKRKRGAQYHTQTHSKIYGYSSPSAQTASLVEQLFNKEFVYPETTIVDFENTEIQKQLFTTPRWEDLELQKLKSQLNDMKSKLSVFDINEWHVHTTKMHPGGLVMNHIRRRMNGELCTQAWCKFREIVDRLDLMRSLEGSDLCSVHLSEAPGAFITSLNHYLSNNGFSSKWTWLGTTLNPYYEGNNLLRMIDDDQFIYESLDHWYFGRDDTGDIMHQDNVLGLAEACHRMGNIDVVTADGSVDCADTPGEQEIITSCLHYSELVTALHMLHPGGKLVLKMFMLFEDSSISLMFILRSAFNQLSVFKPVTSKPGNSEVYVVAQDYKCLPHAFLQLLLTNINADCDKSLLPQDMIPKDFLDSHRACCSQFTQYQIETISQNLTLFQDSEWAESQKNDLIELRHLCMRQYVDKLHVLPIERHEWLVPVYVKPKTQRKPEQYSHRMNRHNGSYIARQQQLHLVWNQRVMQISTFPEESPEVTWLQLQGGELVSDDEVKNWEPIRGRKFALIQSSRFCDNNLLRTYNDVLTNAECIRKPQANYAEFLLEAVMVILKLVENERKFNVVLGDINDQASDVEGSIVSQHETLCDILKKHMNQPNPEAGDNPDTVVNRLLAIDCYTSTMTEAGWCNSLLPMSSFIGALHAKNIEEGDSLILSVPPLLSRINATLVTICQQCFSKVTVVVPDKASYPVCFLLAIGYNPIATGLLDFLRASLEDHHHDNQLLALIPIQYLYESKVMQFLRQLNTTFTKRRINHIIETERLLLKTLTVKENSHQEQKCEL